MKLNHLNLSTSDVARVSAIFANHFSFELLQLGQVPTTSGNSPVPAGSAFALLRGSDAFSLILTEIAPGSPRIYPTDFHIGFTLDTSNEVRAKHQELSEHNLLPDAIKTFEALGVHWTAFYCAIGDGVRIEVNAHD